MTPQMLTPHGASIHIHRDVRQRAAAGDHPDAAAVAGVVAAPAVVAAARLRRSLRVGRRGSLKARLKASPKAGAAAGLRKDAAARRRRLRDHQTASSVRHLRRLQPQRAVMMARSRIRARMHFHRHDLRRVAAAAVGAE